MSAPIVRDGAIVHANGRILAVDEATRLRRDFPHATLEDLGNVTLLPGLINAHTHLELSGCTPGEAPTSFVDWILSMPRRVGRQPDQRADAVFDTATRSGIAQCLRFGVTCVADI